MALLPAVMYLRISRDHTGEGLAHERQRAECERVARERGLEIVETFADTVGAYDRRKVRPEYNRLCDAVTAGRVKHVVVYDVDRLTRQPKQMEWWIEAWEDYGVRLYAASGEFDLANDNGRIFLRFKAVIARGEMERKSARQVLATEQRARRGLAQAGVPLYGYTTKGELIEDEARVVKRIFTSFIATESLFGVARELTNAGIPAVSSSDRRPNAEWASSTVRTMLMNARYHGQAIHRGEILEGVSGNWEPIVTKAEFDRVQAILSDPSRKKNREGTARKWLGSGLYRCGQCGGKVRSSNKYYGCNRAGCPNRSRVLVDEYVERVVRTWLGQPDLAAIAPAGNAAEVDALVAEARELRDRIEVARQEYIRGEVTGSMYTDRTRFIEARLSDVEARQIELTAGTSVGSLLNTDDPQGSWDEASLDARRAIVDDLIDVVLLPAPRGRKVFDPDSVQITWKVGAAAD